MPAQSYLSRTSADPGFLAGLQIGVQSYQNEQNRQEQEQQQAAQEQALNGRYQLQLKNEATLQAMRSAQEADKIKSQNTIQWRQDYWNKTTQPYLDQLNNEQKITEGYLDPKLKDTYDQATRDQAQAHLNEIAQRKIAIGQATPQDWSDKFHDPSPYLQPLQTSITPAFSPAFLKQQKEDVDYKQSQIDYNNSRIGLTSARTNKLLNAPATVDKSLLKARTSADKISLKVGGLINKAYALGPQVTTDGTTTSEGTDSTGMPVSDSKPLQSAKEAVAGYLPALVQNIQNPVLYGSDVAKLAQRMIPRHNGLRSFDDVHNMLNDLYRKDYSGPGGLAAQKAALELRSIVLGEHAPLSDQSQEPVSGASTAPTDTEDDDQ